jgi:GGDEF domain-containing protein
MEDNVCQEPAPDVGRESTPTPKLALDWLRSVFDAEFDRAAPDVRAPFATEAASHPSAGNDPARPSGLAGHDPFGVAARFERGETERALWLREWSRQWRRFQLPERLQRFDEQLAAARSPGEVYRALSEHAVQIVGGYTCLLYPPQEQGLLRPLPNPALRVDAGRITLSLPLAGVGLIDRGGVLDGEDAPFAGLAPLFREERAVSLAHAPFGEGGVILLLERRSDRQFDAEDRELLALLSSRAAAALRHVRLGLTVDALQNTHPSTGLPDEVQLPHILRHARRVADRGEPLTLLGVGLSGIEQAVAQDGRAAGDRIRRTAGEVLRELAGTLGIVVHRSDDEFLLFLPRLTRAAAAVIASRLERQLPGRVGVSVRLMKVEDGRLPAVLSAEPASVPGAGRVPACTPG